MDAKGVSYYADYMNKYARFNLSPVWFSDKLANGRVAADISMAGITQMLQNNGFQRVGKAYIKYKIPAKGTKNYFSIKAIDGEDIDSVNLTVTVNPQFLDRPEYSTNDIAGHVGIYAGKLTMIHCIPYSNVFETDLYKPHWSDSYLYARRILK